jgi:hypothetical protein
MKSKNSTPGYLILTTLLCVLAFFSCKKEDATHAKKDLNEVTASLGGTKLTGSITIVTEGNESAIMFNNPDKLVIIGLAESESFRAGTMNSAELIVSRYGVIVKDESKNEVWLLANNDEESKSKFEYVRTFLPKAKYTATIFNIMEINTGKE